jgi:UDP-N-acetyl-D-mannosaminuronate dehydrogenase
MIVYDIRAEACDPKGTVLGDLESCDLIFICLPTPMNHHASCYTKLIEDTVP